MKSLTNALPCPTVWAWPPPKGRRFVMETQFPSELLPPPLSLLALTLAPTRPPLAAENALVFVVWFLVPALAPRGVDLEDLERGVPALAATPAAVPLFLPKYSLKLWRARRARDEGTARRGGKKIHVARKLCGAINSYSMSRCEGNHTVFPVAMVTLGDPCCVLRW